MGRTREYRTKLELPLARERLFPFFADAANLPALMPPELRFELLTPPPVRFAQGTRLRYRLRIAGVRVDWLTRIALWNPPQEIVHEQLEGPCPRWVHKHLFVETPEGTRLHDVVTYELPFYPLGEVAAPLVHLQLRRIFRYREGALQRGLDL